MADQEKLFSEIIADLRNGYENKETLYNNKIAELNSKLDSNEQLYNAKIEELKEQMAIKEKEYNEKIFELNEQVEYKDTSFKERLFELNEQIEELSEKQNLEQDFSKYSNDNKIINLGKFFNNKRKNNSVFSIHETISYYELEKLATEVIRFGDDDSHYIKDLAK